MTQTEIDEYVNALLRQFSKELGLAGYMRIKKMLEDARVIGPRADGRFLWRVRQTTIDKMVNNSIGLFALTDVQAKKLAEDYDRVNAAPIEVLFLKGMIYSYVLHDGEISTLTVDDIPMFGQGIANAALSASSSLASSGLGSGWLYWKFPFLLIPTGWRRRAKKP